MTEDKDKKKQERIPQTSMERTPEELALLDAALPPDPPGLPIEMPHPETVPEAK